MSVATARYRLLVGLGNPGREYRATRHNVGFMLLDRLAAAERAAWRVEKRWDAELALAPGGVHLLKPQTYMNLSGQSVRAVADFFRIDAGETLVVLDDMALPLSRLRLRANGSAGGHLGLQSVIDHLGTASVARLRIGIGAAQPGGATGHVLGRFSPAEKDALEEALARGEQALALAQASGLEAAMNQFN